jgi:hypothetical protein
MRHRYRRPRIPPFEQIDLIVSDRPSSITTLPPPTTPQSSVLPPTLIRLTLTALSPHLTTGDDLVVVPRCPPAHPPAPPPTTSAATQHWLTHDRGQTEPSIYH